MRTEEHLPPPPSNIGCQRAANHRSYDHGNALQPPDSAIEDWSPAQRHRMRASTTSSRQSADHVVVRVLVLTSEHH